MNKPNIYVGHCRNSDYENDLYKPLKESNLSEKYNFIFPHETQWNEVSSKEILKGVRLMIAEVSYPATGLGIELGFASIYEVPIICVYKKGQKISSSLKRITGIFIEYENVVDMAEKLGERIGAIII